MKQPNTLEEAREEIAKDYFKNWDIETVPHTRSWSDMEEILIDLGKIDLLISLYKDAIELYCPEEEKAKFTNYLHPEEEEDKTVSDDHQFPQFIWFAKTGNCAMRLQSAHGDQGYYYRDAGAWGVSIVPIADRLQNKWRYRSGENEKPDHLSSQECFPCTREEWREDNGEWAPVLPEDYPFNSDELPF